MGRISVGRYCSIARGVIRLGANHPLERPSLHPYFYNPSLGYCRDDVERVALTIGHGAWVGFNSLILPSCRCIGNGAVVGAGTVLTHDVEPYAVVAGNPDRVIRRRFDIETIARIEESRWWEFEPDEAYERMHRFCEASKALQS